MATVNPEKILEDLKAKVSDEKIKNAITKFQETLRYSQFLHQLSRCLDPRRLSSYFTYVMNAVLWRAGIPNAKAKLIITDDKTFLILEEDTKDYGVMPNGQKVNTEYINTAIITQAINSKSVEAYVYVKDKKLREKAIATVLVLGKHHNVKLVNVKEKEVEKVISKYPWLKRDVKGILNVFIAKVRKKGCLGGSHAQEDKG